MCISLRIPWVMEGYWLAPSVLIAHPHRGLREMLHLALLEEGYQVLEAQSLQAALELLTASEVRLLVLFEEEIWSERGLHLPQQVSTNPSLATKHAYVMLTALPEQLTGEERQLLARLHIPIIAEPFELEELLQTVAQATQRITGD